MSLHRQLLFVSNVERGEFGTENREWQTPFPCRSAVGHATVQLGHHSRHRSAWWFRHLKFIDVVWNQLTQVSQPITFADNQASFISGNMHIENICRVRLQNGQEILTR